MTCQFCEGLRAAAEICDAESGRQFNLIETESRDDAKHRRGAKSANAMELAAKIRARAAECQCPQEERGWTPVGERLPDDDAYYLVAVEDRQHRYIIVDCNEDGNWAHFGSSVTHWIPLPEPPLAAAPPDDHATPPDAMPEPKRKPKSKEGAK